MSISAHSPYEEPESSSTRWVLVFVLLSLLAHAVIIIALLLITIFLPAPKITVPAPPPSTTLTLLPPPPATKPKTIFLPTKPQANVTPTPQKVESANDTKLTTKSKVAHDPNSIMPEINGKPHASDMNDSPLVKAPPKPEVSSTPPTPKQAQPQKPTPPQPNPNQGKQPTTQTAKPVPTPLPPTPQPKPQPQVDPLTGLPVLPPINAPTLAPPDSAVPTPTPAPSPREMAVNSHGAIGQDGDNSPAAMSSVLGKYRQKVYAAVGSVWDVKVDNALQLLGVGEVRVQYTIYADGTVETKVLDPGGSTLANLLAISINSIREAAPYDKFDDYPGLRDAIIKEQGGDGSSYTGEFTFSIYSTN